MLIARNKPPKAKVLHDSCNLVPRGRVPFGQHHGRVLVSADLKRSGSGDEIAILIVFRHLCPGVSPSSY